MPSATYAACAAAVAVHIMGRSALRKQNGMICVRSRQSLTRRPTAPSRRSARSPY